MDERLINIKRFAEKEYSISVEEVRQMIADISNFTREYLHDAGFDERKVRAVLTKLRDAGRRSPPWRPTSSRVPGRPQDGSDGNRINRWLLPSEHKFYADEIIATLVEVKYYLELLSMEDAPPLLEDSIQDSFSWLTGHRIVPGAYRDPVQLIPINLQEVIQNPRNIESGHLIPLDRGGKHIPANAFMVLTGSNRLQGSLKLNELLDLMRNILGKHAEMQDVQKLAKKLGGDRNGKRKQD